MCELSSFDEIGRNPSISGNIAMTLGIEGPGSSASRCETKGEFWYCRCWIMGKSVWIVEFWRNFKKSIEIWQYCPYTENRGPWVLSVQVGDKRLKRPLEGSDGGWICINGRVLTKLERIHRNQAILTLHWKSRVLGPQRTGGRQRVKTTIGRVGWRLNLYDWSSFGEIIRKSSKLGNIATTLGIEGPESSASRWETKGWFWHCRCQVKIKSVNSRVLIRLEKILLKLAILPLHSESGALGLRRTGGRQKVNFGILWVGWW